VDLQLEEAFYLLGPMKDCWVGVVTCANACVRTTSAQVPALIAWLCYCSMTPPGNSQASGLHSSSLPVPGRGKQTRKSLAWADIYWKEEDDQPYTQQWAPRALGVVDMIVTKALKAHTALATRLLSLISCLIYRVWRRRTRMCQSTGAGDEGAKER
jgi:hypothetical protein